MRAGKFDRTVYIQYPHRQKDDLGAITEIWGNHFTLKAQVLESTTEEFKRAFGTGTETLTIFRTWYVQLQPEARLFYGDHVYDIRAVKEIGRRQFLEFRAVARPSASDCA